jgi:hypothetical protein
MASRQCYHCKEWVEEGEPHDCWTTTEKALTHELSDDLQEAYERLRETAAAFGEQRIYASHHCIMFSRKACYFFVRPKRSALEVCLFLGRAVKAPQVRRATPSSKSKVANILRITHRDEVEPPITEWMREAYDSSDALSSRAPAKPEPAKRKRAKKTARRAATSGKQGKKRSRGRPG